VDRAVRTDESLFPGFGTEQAGFEDEGHGLGDEAVEPLDGDLDLLLLVHEDGVLVGRVLAEVYTGVRLAIMTPSSPPQLALSQSIGALVVGQSMASQ